MADLQRKKVARTNYHVAWICPVADLELLPAVLMLDEEHERPDFDTETDENKYEFGSAAGHNIVLATCRQGMTGNVNVSSITAPLFKTFPNIRMTLLVGIGGGVPQPDLFSDPLNDLRLGDVVVGWPTSADGRGAVVYYESGRSKVDGFEMTGTLDKPHAVILNALPSMRLDHDLERSNFHLHMAKLQGHKRLGNRFKHPGLEHDKLFQSHYRHVGGYKSNCKDCDSHELVQREPRDDSEKDLFIYHQGRIATGNSVIMDGEKRDLISTQCGGPLCIEMEAAGIEVNSRCLVIRGISDYADSHKSDLWRSYAAAKAVAFARELLGKIPARDVKEKMASGQLDLYYPEPMVVEVDEMNRRDDQPSKSLLECPGKVENPWGQSDKWHHVPGNKHWLVDRSINPYFTGRREVIAKIVRTITGEAGANEQRRVVITGMGGQGKSEICLHVANEVREGFWGIFWVDVSTRTSAEEKFSEVAEALGCPKTVDAVRKSLSNVPHTNQWLLILDNADDPSRDYQVYFPSGNRGAILMTSRNSQCGLLATASGHEELDSLEEHECVQLLQQTAQLSEVAYKSEDYEIAVTLVRYLGHHTLAILHAGSYMATTHCTMSEYMDFFRTNRRRLLERSRGQGQSRYDTVYATFGASMEFLELSETGGSEETRQDSLQLLEVLSTFHYMSAPLDVLVDAWEGAKEALKNPEGEMDSGVLTSWHVARVPYFVSTEKNDVKFRIIEAVARLESLALVRTDRSARAWRSVSMHPLVHSWVGDRQNQQERNDALRRTECIVALSDCPFESWRPYHYQLIPHLKRLVESDVDLMDDMAQSTSVLQVCVHIAATYSYMDIRRDFHEFVDCIFQRLDLYNQEPTKELRDLYVMFAKAVSDEGSRPGQALRVYEAIARLDEKTLGENDEDRLIVMRSLGEQYRLNGQVKEAISLLRKAVKEIQGLGKGQQLLFSVQYYLASALSDDRKNKEAIMLLEEIVMSDRTLLSEDNPDRRSSIHLLATAYLRDKKFSEAIRLLEEVFHTEAQTLGEEHFITATTQSWLADAYVEAGRLSDAIPLYERVVNTKKLVLRETHPDMLNSQQELAQAYLNDGRAWEAIELLEEVVNIRNSTLDDTDQQRLLSQHELGRAYLEAERFEEAIDIFEQVVKVENLLYDQGHPSKSVSQELLHEAYSVRDIYFPSARSAPESRSAQPDAALQPVEAISQASANYGPIIEVEGQKVETSRDNLEGILLNSLVPSERSELVETLRGKISSESSKASTNRVSKRKVDGARRTR